MYMYFPFLFQLFPSQEADRYTPLIEDLLKYGVQPKSAKSILYFKSNQNTTKDLNLDSRYSHSTIELHSLQLSMERFYHSLEAVDDSYDDMNIPLFQDNSSKNWRTGASNMIENVFHAHVEMDKKYVRQSCSEDKTTMPYLSGFFTGWSISIIKPRRDMKKDPFKGIFFFSNQVTI